MTSLALKLKAREIAAGSYNAMIRGVGLYGGFTVESFLREYPTQARYVDEWWEERYLPLAKKGM